MKPHFLPGIDYLEAFVKVVEAGRFNQAAKQLGISTPAVSKKIAFLEKGLGIHLLVRTTRTLTLTESGEVFLSQCKRVLQEWKETQQLTTSLRAEPSGELKVVVARHIAEKYVVPHLKEFVARFPNLTLNLELAERFPDLEKEHIDIVVGMSMVGPDTLVQRKISTTRYALCASPSYLKKNGTPHTPRNLAGHLFINHSMRRPRDVLMFRGGVQVRVASSLYLNDTSAMLRCALDGLGIVKLHHYVVADELKKGRLVEILKSYQEPEQPIYLYYLPSRYVQPKIRHFIDFVARKLGGDVEGSACLDRVSSVSQLQE